MPSTDDPLVLAVPATEPTEAAPPALPEPSDLEPHPAVAAEQLVERAGGDGRPLVDDRHAIAHVLGLLEQVGVQEHGRPPLAKPANDLAHVVASDGVERAGGLVEHHQRGVAEQRHGEPEPLLHSLREGADPVIAALEQTDGLQGRCAPPPPTPPWAARGVGNGGGAPPWR